MPHACSRGVCGTAKLGDTISVCESCLAGALVTVNVTLILTTVPDTAVAQKLAAEALAARLCACVTQLGTVQSSYHWQGAVETAQEIQLLFKTSAARAFELEQYIQLHHPYDTPEVLSWQATASAAYGQWITAETQRPLHV
jgi:periplasmic divalent cation tolerance protein